MRVASASDPGRVRSSNQDFAFVSEDLFAVADGMGGHAGGEIAARTAIDALAASFRPDAGVEGLIAAANAANRAVFLEADRDPELRGMGTTLTAAALVAGTEGPTLGLINVGDSRAYLLQHGTLRRLTEDHSVVEEMVRTGELTEAQAAVHPHRHIVTRAIGIDQSLDVDAWDLGDLRSGRLMLCSDGLTNECSEDEIAAVLRSVADPARAADELVQRALAHGGGDNITVVVIDLDDDETVAGLTAERSDAAAAPTRVTTSRPSAPTRTPPRAARARPERRRSARIIWANERMVSARVVLFVLVLLGIFAGAGGFVIWYNNATYYVGTNQGKLAIFEGRPGGLLWFKPALVYRSSVATSSVLASNLPLLGAGLLEPSYSSARAALNRLSTENAVLGATAVASTTTTAPALSSATTTTLTLPTTTTTAVTSKTSH